MNQKKLKVRKSAALDKFDGSVVNLAEFLGIASAAVYQWGEYVPEVRAYQLREMFPKIGEVDSSAGNQSAGK